MSQDTSARGWAIYVRVSTDEQAMNGVSLDAQERQCRLRLESEGHSCVDVYRDAGASAKDLRRPELQRLLADIESRRVGGVIIQKLDRLSRNVPDFLATAKRLQELGVDLLSVQEKIDTSGPGGRFVTLMLMGLAQLEREQTGERVRAVIKHKKSLGEFCGGPIPAGLRSTGAVGHRVLEVDPETGPKMAAVWAMIVQGSTLRQVADHLTAVGVPPPRRGGHWQKANVSRLLSRKAYIGRLVDRETFDSCHAVLDKRFAPTFGRTATDRSTCHPNTQRPWMLQGIARCGQCGSALVGSCHGNARKPYYRCSGRTKRGKEFCGSTNIPAETYEQAVIDALIREIGSGTELAQAIVDHMAERRIKAAPELKRRAAVQLEIDHLASQIEAVIDLKLAGTLSKSATIERLEDLQRRRQESELRLGDLNALAATLEAGQLDAGAVMFYLRAVINDLRQASPALQREVIQGLVREAQIKRDKSVTLTLVIPETVKKRNPPSGTVGTLVPNGDLDGT